MLHKNKAFPGGVVVPVGFEHPKAGFIIAGQQGVATSYPDTYRLTKVGQVKLGGSCYSHPLKNEP